MGLQELLNLREHVSVQYSNGSAAALRKIILQQLRILLYIKSYAQEHMMRWSVLQHIFNIVLLCTNIVCQTAKCC